MNITDLSIESTNFQITALSEQEANEVVGGSNTSNALSSLAKKRASKYKFGTPGEGGEYDPSCPAVSVPIEAVSYFF